MHSAHRGRYTCIIDHRKKILVANTIWENESCGIMVLSSAEQWSKKQNRAGCPGSIFFGDTSSPLFTENASFIGRFTRIRYNKNSVFSSAVFGENPRYCYSFGVVVVWRSCCRAKTLTLCNISDIYLKL